MLKAFAVGYKDFSLEALQLESLEGYLNKAFDEELRKLNEGSIYLVSAYLGDDVVGFATFHQEREGAACLRVMAVDPAYWKKGIGRTLTFSICDKLPDLNKLVLVTRRISRSARAFYEALGFKVSTYVFEGADPDLYVGYECRIE